MDPTNLLLELIPQNLFTPSTLTILWQLNKILNNFLTKLFQSITTPLYYNLPNFSASTDPYLPSNMYHLIYIIQQINHNHYYHQHIGNWSTCQECHSYGKLQEVTHWGYENGSVQSYLKQICITKCTFHCPCGNIMNCSVNRYSYNITIMCPKCNYRSTTSNWPNHNKKLNL